MGDAVTTADEQRRNVAAFMAESPSTPGLSLAEWRYRVSWQKPAQGVEVCVGELRALLDALEQAQEEARTYEADAHGDARPWNGHYVKEHYILVTPTKERVLCWPNAGYMNASDGSGRQWAPCADCSVERIEISEGLRIVRGERKA